MTDRSAIAGVVLAAGAGERLRPLSLVRPKPLCPVANVALLDGALDRVAGVVPPGALAVNVHHHRDQMEAHLATRSDVHVSVEPDRALGTAGALGLLRGWLDGRSAVVVNGDSWTTGTLGSLVSGWDGERVRVLVHGEASGEPAQLTPVSLVVASLIPWSRLRRLRPEPSGLYERCWRPAATADDIEVLTDAAPFVDCGTPASYLRANLLAGPVVAPDAVVGPDATVTGSVVGGGAVVEGAVRSSVVWPGARVQAHESLDHAVRTADSVTVLVR